MRVSLRSFKSVEQSDKNQAILLVLYVRIVPYIISVD